MDLGDIVVIDKRNHPYWGWKGKIVGRRGNRAPGDPWFLVYVMSRGRSYLFPQSMLAVVDKRTEDREILVWPVSGETMERPQ
jgi:hypothetical protein